MIKRNLVSAAIAGGLVLSFSGVAVVWAQEPPATEAPTGTMPVPGTVTVPPASVSTTTTTKPPAVTGTPRYTG